MGFKNALFVVSRSDMYIVSIQQTVHSALLRGFEACDVPGSMCTSLDCFVAVAPRKDICCKSYALNLFLRCIRSEKLVQRVLWHRVKSQSL